MRAVDRRQDVRVAVPCGTCFRSGSCLIEQQIEQDLVLHVIGVAEPVVLSLSCSLYVDRSLVVVKPPPRPPRWTPEARAAAGERARRRWASLTEEQRRAVSERLRKPRRRPGTLPVDSRQLTRERRTS